MKNRVFTGSDLRKKLHRAARGSPKDSESGFRKKNSSQKSKNGQKFKFVKQIFYHYYCTCVRLQACWWPIDVGDIMLEAIFGCWWRKKHVGEIFWDVSDTQVGHQHHKIQKYDVGNRFWILVTSNLSCWLFLECWCQ